MSKTVLIACKLPSGLQLDGINGPVVLNGQNSTYVPDAPGLTHVDADEWTYLSAQYAEHSAFKSNSIFATGSAKVEDQLALADDLQGEKTGFEGIDPLNPGANLEPQNPSNVDKALNENAGKQTPKKALKGADKVAALEAAAAKD